MPSGFAAQVGPYALYRILGTGGMGQVWQATHTPSDTQIAFKIVTKDIAEKEVFQRSFRREVHTIAALDHAHIVRVHDHGVLDKKVVRSANNPFERQSPWIAMELAPNGHLDDVHNWSTFYRLIRQLLLALGHAHARGIIHRDIKPANVLLAESPSGQLNSKLSDFGISHLRSGGKASGTQEILLPSAGTPRYMAPEQFEARWRDYGPWTDLYALGAMVHELVCKTPAFDGRGGIHLAFLHVTQPPAAWHPTFAVPAALEPWTHRLLAKSIHQRFSCAAHALWTLEEIWTSHRPSDESLSLTAISEGKQVLLADSAEAEKSHSLPDSSEPLSGSPAADSRVLPGPPLAPSWRPRVGEKPPKALARAGLGLFGLRLPPFVGREIERDRIWKVLGTAQRNEQNHFVFIEGSGGVGKTRLMTWITRRAHEICGATTLRIDHPTGNDHGLSHMLETHLGCVGLDVDRAHVRTREFCEREGLAIDPGTLLGLALEHRLPELSEQTPVVRFDHPAQRYQALLELLNGHRGLLILWLDEPQRSFDSLKFMEFVRQARTVVRGPVVVVATCRIDELETLGDHSNELIQRFGNEENTLRISLSPLQPDEEREMIGRLLPLEDRLVDWVRQHMHGSPHYAVQLIGDWVRQDVLEDSYSGFRLLEGHAPTTPPDFDNLWEKRIIHLCKSFPDPEIAVQSLEIAAGLGLEINDEEWSQACGHAGLPILAGLVDTLVEEGLARRNQAGWRFSHDKLTRVLLKHARTQSTWVSVHSVCLQVVEDRYGESYSAQGASRKWKHIRQIYTRDHPTSLDAHFHYIRNSLIHFGDSDRVEFEISVLVANAPETTKFSRSAKRLQAEYFIRTGRFDDAEETLLFVLAEEEKIGIQEDQIETRGLLAKVYAERFEIENAQYHYEYIIAAIKAKGDRRQLGSAHNGMAVIFAETGDYRNALNHYEEALRLAEEVNYKVGVHTTRANIAMVLAELGRLDEAIALFEDCLIRCRASNNRDGEARTRLNLGVALDRRGDLDRATAVIEESVSISQHMGEIILLAVGHSTLGRICRKQGKLRLSEAHQQKAIAYCTSARTPHLVGVGHLELGHLALAKGSNAFEFIDTARAIAAKIGATPKSELMKGIEHLEQAQRMFDRGQPLKWGELPPQE